MTYFFADLIVVLHCKTQEYFTHTTAVGIIGAETDQVPLEMCDHPRPCATSSCGPIPCLLGEES